MLEYLFSIIYNVVYAALFMFVLNIKKQLLDLMDFCFF